jgi:hypothetical protein
VLGILQALVLPIVCNICLVRNDGPVCKDWNIGNALSNEMRKELEQIGGEIVRKCQGLSLAVKAMGGILRGHIEVSKWREF